jgi:hypothetical protein
MSTRLVIVSDLSGQEIADGDNVEVRVLELEGLSQPVKIDASTAEADRLSLEAKPLALLELVLPNGEVRRVAIEADQFKRSIRGDADEVLANAEGLSFTPQAPAAEEPKRRTRRPRGEGVPAASRGEKIDYTSVEYAGRVKRGQVSEGEKETVRNHFDEVNRNLEAAGQRTIDLSDIAMVEKYGLQELAKERGITPAAKS